jgi:glycosyltransferase involved in cell wall biosynthesis
MNSGGIERCVIEMNSFLKKNEYNSFVLTKGGKLTYVIKQAKGIVIQLDVATKNPIKIIKNIFNIKKIIIDNKIDVVDVLSRAPAWSTYFACKMTKTPLVTTIHGNYSLGGFFFSFFKKLYNKSIMLGDYVICVSDFIKQGVLKNYPYIRRKYFESKVFVVNRGTDTKQFDPEAISQQRIISTIKKMGLPEDKQILLLPARFTDWKGQLYFLDVLNKMKNRNFICLMIGFHSKQKSYIKKIKNKIKKFSLENIVRVEEPISDMPTLYLISHLVVSSSIKGEAFGLVSIEGQAMERIVIATALGGSLETIRDNETGFLVDPINIEKFAGILDDILLMPLDERIKIGQVARQNVLENFTIEKMCRETLEIYKKSFGIV